MSDNNFKVKHGLEVANGVTINAGGITVTGAAALDSLTLTTPLPAIYGGTGTSNSSGTGDLVLSTSPVFHTSIATDSTSFNLINTTATTVNFAGAATNLHIAGSTGTTTVNNDLHVAGDLTYDGQATVIQATPIAVDQPVIHLADGNTADLLDQGVIGKYNTSKYAGLVRDASDTGTWKLFSNLLTTPGNTVDFAAVTYDNLKIGALNATTGTFSAGVSGTTGTFSGAVSGTTGTFSGAVSGTTGTFSGAATATNFVSTASTGTAPFTVNSTTPVAGLNIGGYSAGLKTATGSVSVGSATAPTAGQVLTATNGTTAAWTTPAATGVTSVVGAGTVNGLTLTGTVTSTGNLTLGGTLSGIDLATAVSGVLPISHGGTGVGTATGTGSVVLSTSPAITTSLTTPSTSFDLVNTTATTVNVAGAATSLHLGAGSGTTTINNNLQVAGTITYNGTANQLSPTNLSVSDSLIYMSAGNPADILDIGIIGHYANTKYSGFVRDASDAGSWKLFSNITTTPGATVDFAGASYDSLYVGNLHSNQLISTVATGTAPLVVSSATPVTGLNIDGYSTGLKTATTVVSIGAATAPTAGQVLTAINGTSAAWSTPAGADLSAVSGILGVSNGGTGSSGPATGTGNVVLATSPTLITPSLGSATATSVNKVTITQPASGSTLTISDGGVLETVGSHHITLTASADSNVTLPSSGTLITDSAATLSSLSSVGTITTGTWSGNFGTVSGSNLTNLTAANLTGTIPSTVLANSSVYLGSTSVALNRPTGSMVLSDVSIGGASGALTTATGAVVVSASTAPTVGQVLTAIDGVSAHWAAPGAADLSTATGTLGVSHGGSGVTASTGTTKLVLSTSPTLSTSVLTDSTSFDLLNTTATTVNFAGAATALSMGSSTGTTTINNNLSVYGSIVFNNGATEISSTVLSVDDPLIYLADNNASDLLDLGFFCAYNPGVHTHTGLVRDATDKVWKLFSGITAEPVGNVVDFSDVGLAYDDLHIGKLTTTGVNKVTITQPTNSATLTLADASSLITSGAFSTTLRSTAATDITLPTSGTLLADSASVNIGTTSVPLNRTSGALTLSGVNIDGYAGALKSSTGSVVVSSTTPSTGQVLVATGASTATWQTLAASSSGTVTSVGMTVPSFLSVANSPITGSGTLAVTLSGTALPIANGGTGATAATGTGNVVLASSPTLTTPTLGVASATSINKVAITAPATSATLQLADGSTLVTAGAFSTTLRATAATDITLPTTGTLATTAYVTANAAPLASPTFTGVPLAPTASVGTNTTQIATTAFVLANAAPLASPTFTGTPAAPTASADTNTTQLATTAFVISQASSTTPVMDGSAAVGTSLKYARADHVHASDTTKVGFATVNTVTNTISDGIGNLRSIPQSNQTNAYTLVASDNGKNINITTGGITIPTNSIFAAGDVISIYNQSGTAQNISWSGGTVYLAGTSTAKSSPLSLAARGILTIMFAVGGASPEIIVSGNV